MSIMTRTLGTGECLDIRRRAAAWLLANRQDLTDRDLSSIALIHAVAAIDGSVTAQMIVDMVRAEIRRRRTERGR